MKAVRRHELEKNQLADWLAAAIARIKPYQNAIWGTVLLVVVASAAYSWWSSRSSGKESEAWDRFFAAMENNQYDSSDFEEIAGQYPGSRVAQWALVVAGDLRLAMGCNALFESKATANQELNGAGDQDGAIDDYLKALDSDLDGLLRQRALFGLGRAYEALGDLKEAEKRYRELRDQWPDGAYTLAADERLRDLQKPSIRELYDKMADYQPKPAYSGELGRPGGTLPFDPATLPEDGPLYQPKIGPGVEGLQEKGPTDQQPKDAAAPATPPPAETQPASDTPSDAAKEQPAKAAEGQNK